MALPWLAATMGAAGSLAVQNGAVASPAGWYVATVPGTGADDVLLGSTCANALQCWTVGVTIQNINTNGTDTPIVESWNGTAWTLEPQPPLPAGQGGGFFDVSCVSGSDTAGSSPSATRASAAPWAAVCCVRPS